MSGKLKIHLKAFFGMKQYYYHRRIIAKLFSTIVIWIAAIGMSHANDKIAETDWYWKMARQEFSRKSEPPVTITSATLSADNTFQAAVGVKSWTNDNSLGFVLAAPAGDVTTASLHVDALDELSWVDGPEMEFQREVAVAVHSLGYVRGHHLVKVEIPAVIPGTFGKRLKSGSLSIFYSTEIKAENVSDSPQSVGPFREMLTRLVANPTDLHRFEIPLEQVPQKRDLTGNLRLGSYPDALASFEVSREGFVQFSGKELAKCGVDLANTSVTSISVWADDGEQAIMPSAVFRGQTGDESIRPDDTFLLYARDSQSAYTINRTYWIRQTEKLPRLMNLSISAPAQQDVKHPQMFQDREIVEVDNPPVLTRNDQFLTILGYRWAWWTWTSDENTSSVPSPRNYNTPGIIDFSLPGLADANASASLGLEFYSHHWSRGGKPISFQTRINGTDLGSIAVNADSLIHSLTMPAGVLHATTNSLVLTPVINDETALPDLCFDRLTVNYSRNYRMTSSTLEFYPPSPEGGVVGIELPDLQTTGEILVADISGLVPTLIGSKGGAINHVRYLHTSGPADRRYLAATRDSIHHVALKKYQPGNDLRSVKNKGDVIVIAWPDFISDLEPWVNLTKDHGHDVAIVSVDDIYNQFGYGQQSPHAIREFLRYAAMHWQGSGIGPACSYVLLVGDSTSAYRNEFRNDVINYVPSLRIMDEEAPFASDQWYVSLFGNDVMADAIIGRFSVNNHEDLRTIIQKQIDYANISTTGSWQQRLGFIADHTEFDDTLRRVMTHAVPPGFSTSKVSMSELPWIDNYYFPKDVATARRAKVSPEATVRIRDMFNEGAAVVTYFGHGSPNIWSNERMWFGGDSPNSDNLLLTNRDKLPVVINMTCNSGAIDYPQPHWNIAISEDFLRVKNGGAIACFVPSGPGLTINHERLMTEIGYQLFSSDPRSLGESLQVAMWKYLADGNPRELAEMFILLGDPLLQPHITVNQGDKGTSAPIGSLEDLSIASWKRIDDPQSDKSTATLEFSLKNDTPSSLRQVRLKAVGDGIAAGESEPVDIIPFSRFTVQLDVVVRSGLNSFEILALDSQSVHAMKSSTPVAVARLRRDSERGDFPPAIVDPDSMVVQYSSDDQGEVSATVSVQVYNLSREALSNLRMGLQDDSGLVLQKSIVTVPSMAPGGSARMSLSTRLRASASSRSFMIRFDPSGFYPEFTRFPSLKVNLGRENFPDLALVSVLPSNNNPTEGETVFFDLELTNRGKVPAQSVKPAGYITDSAGKRQRLFSQVMISPSPFTVDPGTSCSVRLRWDPVNNAGSNTLVFTANSDATLPERNPADNETTIVLTARTKAAVKNLGVDVLPLSEEDRRQRQVRIVCKIKNDGESEAHGLRIAFYGSAARAEADYLGDREVENIAPGEMVETVLTYKLKPGEESRPFRFTADVMYKGSRQRIPAER